MAMSSPSAAVRGTALLLGMGIALAFGPVPAAGAAQPAQGGRTPAPYRPDGLLVRLPGGGNIRLVWPREGGRTETAPSGPAAPSQPLPSKPGPPKPVPSRTGPAKPVSSASASPKAAPSKPGSPSDCASAAASVFPVPLLSTLFPAAVPGPPYRTPGADSSPVTAAASSAAAAAGTPSAPAGAGSRHFRPSEDQNPGRTPPRGGPPPLGPDALAAKPLPGQPVAVRGGSARELLSRRLLPLGMGLSLIGCGAALFGWRLRRL
ncbi:hypothetical protein ABH941_003672 [Streptacidiphilus sp. EB103A]